MVENFSGSHKATRTYGEGTDGKRVSCGLWGIFLSSEQEIRTKKQNEKLRIQGRGSVYKSGRSGNLLTTIVTGGEIIYLGRERSER